MKLCAREMIMTCERSTGAGKYANQQPLRSLTERHTTHFVIEISQLESVLREQQSASG